MKTPVGQCPRLTRAVRVEGIAFGVEQVRLLKSRLDSSLGEARGPDDGLVDHGDDLQA